MVKIENPTGEFYLDLIGTDCEIDSIALRNRTDRHNDPVVVERVTPISGVAGPWGRLFFVKDYLNKESLIFVIMAPDIVDSKIILTDYRIKVDHFNYPFAYGRCPLGEEEKELRAFLLSELKNRETYSMVNNWGDCNNGENINYDFYYREIDAASELGADVVQIDDGWQIGSTVTTRIYREDGEYTFYHNFYDGFWKVNTEKFPRGLSPLVEYAEKKNVKLGLWFAPDSRDDFANYGRDISFLERAYQTGFKYFKLDMVVLKTEGACRRFIKMLKEISEFGDDVSLQIDVTGDVERLGFLCGFEYGRLFVENRFCKFRSYYPHVTLKNLWKLSRYLPAQMLQMEIPNCKLFPEAYRSDDPFAPITYGSDYIFASVMVSNPLLWTEVQNLAPEDAEDIKRLMAAWKKHRKELSDTDIMPIGSEPNGCSLTGFLCMGDGYGYIVALRELCGDSFLTVSLPCEAKNTELIVSSDGVNITEIPGTLNVEFSDVRQYVFCRFEF